MSAVILDFVYLLRITISSEAKWRPQKVEADTRVSFLDICNEKLYLDLL